HDFPSTIIQVQLFEQVFETLAVGFVKRLQLRGGAGVADKLMTGQDYWLCSSSQQRLGRRATNHVDDHRTGNRGYGAGPPLQTFQFDYAIARRTHIVDHQVGAVDELLARRRCCVSLLAMRFRHDRNHGQAAPLSAHGRFHDHGANPASRNYDERVIRTEWESVQDLLSVAFVILKIERRSQPVGPYDRRMIRERQLDQGDETNKTT